jgi:hypothetical protein
MPMVLQSTLSYVISGLDIRQVICVTSLFRVGLLCSFFNNVLGLVVGHELVCNIATLFFAKMQYCDFDHLAKLF